MKQNIKWDEIKIKLYCVNLKNHLMTYRCEFYYRMIFSSDNMEFVASRQKYV